jgi:2-oxoglutarate dehydrogenase E2 component (dihydrolipoamide succinyltransferase)
VRYQAEEKGINPASITGTGKDGRVLKGDVLAAAEKAPASEGGSLSASPIPPSAGAGERTSRKKMSPLRQKIAARLLAAQQETAHLTTFNEVDLSNIMALRTKFQERFVKKHEVKLGFMSFFVKAAVHALHVVPTVNSRLDGEEVVQNHFYDIGVAISTDKGLFVPVVRDADQLSFAGVEKAIAAYAKKARDGKITLPDMEGGVFTITNGGVFGSLMSTPILNPPQCGILGMHTIQERPVAIAGRVEIRPMMYLALTYDHRLVDGREAVTFLATIKEAVENPAAVLLEV